MKLNEIDNVKRVNENAASYVAKSLASSLTGMPVKASQYQVKDQFIKNFVTSTQNELVDAIKAGTVTTGAVSAPPTQSAPLKPAAPAPGSLSSWQQKTQTTAPAATQSTVPNPKPKFGSTPDQIRKAKQAAAAATAQASMTPAQPKPAAPKTPEQIRIEKQKAAAAAAQAQMKRTTESAYHQLNQVFEGIMNLTEQTSVADFITKKTMEYLGPLSQRSPTYIPQIKSIARTIEKAYAANGSANLRAPMTSLGNLVYTIASTGSQQSQSGVGNRKTAQPVVNPAFQQVNSVLPKLNSNDLINLKSNIDSILSRKQQ